MSKMGIDLKTQFDNLIFHCPGSIWKKKLMEHGEVEIFLPCLLILVIIWSLVMNYVREGIVVEHDVQIHVNEVPGLPKYRFIRQ